MRTRAIKSVDGSAACVNAGPSPSCTDLQQGMVGIWFTATSVANATRYLMGKEAGATGGLSLFKRGVNGTQLRFQALRATANHTIDSPSGTLVANKRLFLAVTWDINNSANAHMWLGDLLKPATDVGATVAAGSGTPATDAASNLTWLGLATGGGWPGIGWWAAMSNRADFTTTEIRAIQRSGQLPKGCVQAFQLGQSGTGKVPDLSGNGNHGTVTVTVPVSECLPGVA